MIDDDALLFRAAYDALVENCIYQQTSASQAEGLRIIARLGERLAIEPTDSIRDALAGLEVV